MADIETDLLIIGAGPSGLYATYYAGFRGLRVALVDSLPLHAVAAASPTAVWAVGPRGRVVRMQAAAAR